MAKLNAAQRRKLPAKDFAGPDRSYPIPDKAHARAALARAKEYASPEEQHRIEAKVHRKFPGMKMKSEGEKKSHRRKYHRRKATIYKNA